MWDFGCRNIEVTVPLPELRFPEFKKAWATKPWKSVAPLQRGFDLPVSEFIEGSFPVVYSNGILRKHIEPKVSGPGVVTGRSGTIGKVTFVEEDYWPHNTSLWVTNFCGNDPHWISELLRQQRLEYISTGSGVPTLNRNEIHRLKVSIPALPEQKKIAAFLSAVDSKLEALEAQLAGWREYKRGMMQALFSQTLRFKANDGSNFPDWERKKIRNFAEVNPSTKNIPDTFKYIDLEAVKAGRLAETKVYSNLDAPSRAQRVLTTGDILFQTVRPYQMNNLYFDRDGEYVASTGYTVLQSSLSQKYLYHFLHTHGFVNEVMKRCTGTSYPAISSSDLANIIVKLPSLPEQQKIANALSAIDTKIEALTARLDATREFKRGLLQKMFA